MRIFSHWNRVQREVEIGGSLQRLRVYGGSDQSVADAARDAERRLARLIERIRSGRRADPTYEADVREEITARVDPRNIVTRNRYGAEVLNSANVMFVDIDDPLFTMTFWEILFRRRVDIAQRKQRIREFVHRRAGSPQLSGLGIRLYETHKGIRAIITGRDFGAKSPESRKIMRDLRADHIYALLCAKQGCFRARLTPKPYRMKCPTHRVVYPRLDGRTELEFQKWLAEYETLRPAYATCRFVENIGPERLNPVVEYHDRATGAFSGLKLA